ncbi:hypothetical protein J6590_095954 [Homalodisca vitripennis]|nr:hypothetical protein J6590_012710 [Homalodisca vitripennis]KAG8334203.1 hypothetical protein J6590_095954 [Homalodisca vitripennis]
MQCLTHRFDSVMSSVAGRTQSPFDPKTKKVPVSSLKTSAQSSPNFLKDIREAPPHPFASTPRRLCWTLTRPLTRSSTKVFIISLSPLQKAVVHLLKSYLAGRSYRICFYCELSTLRPIYAGVPRVRGSEIDVISTNNTAAPLMLCGSLAAESTTDIWNRAKAMLPWIVRNYGS